MSKLIYIGIKEDEKAFRIVNPHLLKEDCDKLPKGKYRLTIEKYRKNKSNSQLGYLYAGVYPLVLKALNDAGWEFTSIDDVDELCKSKFADHEVINRDSGEIIKVPGLKREFTSVEMMTYIDAIRNWASEYLNTFIPEPETQITMELK